MMHAAITGATGFIGQAVCRAMLPSGWKVTGLVRQIPPSQILGVNYSLFDLDREFPQQSFDSIHDADVLVHLSYIADGARILERNVAGSRRLLEAAERAQIRKRIFISSFSASVDAVSAYGRQKFEIEQLFSKPGDVSLRLGFVLGRGGGLFDSTLRFLEKSPVVPLVDSGRQPVQVLLVSDLTRIIEFVARNPVPSMLRVASADSITIRGLYELLSQKLEVKKLFLPVPFVCIYPVAWLAGKVGVRLPVNTENLQGLRRARFLDVTSDLKVFPFELPDAVTAIKSLKL